MTESIRLKVVTPDGSRLDEEVASVTARSEVGEFCVLPSHRPILAALRAGRLLVKRADGETEEFVVDRGFFEGGPDHVNVITSGFATLGEIDVDDVESELAALQEKMAVIEKDDPASEGLLLEIEWAGARLDIVKSRQG